MKLLTIENSDRIEICNTDYRNVLLKTELNTDLIIVDPPYNININNLDWDNNFDYEELFVVLKSILSPNGTILLFGPPQNLRTYLELIDTYNFELQDLLIWQKPNVTPSSIRTKGYTTKSREYIFYITNKGAKPFFNLSPFEAYHDGIYKYPRVTAKERVHVCQKPKSLIEDLMLRHSKPNDLVVDLFLGSGVSAFTAKKLKRRFIGYEKDVKTFKSIKKRLFNA